jgi:hypothetical protein
MRPNILTVIKTYFLLVGNWYTNTDCQSNHKANSVPGADNDAILIGNVSPVVTSDWTPPAGIDSTGLTGAAHTSGVVFNNVENTVNIAGNATFEAATKLDIPIEIIESDGSKLFAVKRTDLKTDSKERKLLAFADNHSTDLSDFDNDLITEDFDSELLNEWDFELPENESFGDIDFENIQSNENRNIEKPSKEVTCPKCLHKFDV